MGDKAQKHLSLMGKMQQNQGEQRKLFGDETADKITELDVRLTKTTTRTMSKQGCKSDSNN